MCVRHVYFSLSSEATELASESGRVWDPELRQGQKEIAKRPHHPQPHSGPGFSEPGGGVKLRLIELGASLGHGEIPWSSQG